MHRRRLDQDGYWLSGAIHQHPYGLRACVCVIQLSEDADLVCTRADDQLGGLYRHGVS